MRLPIVYDGQVWRKATMTEYNNELVNVPVYGKANYLFRDVWDLPIVDTNATTGAKVVKCGRSVQFRFSCARTTETAQAVRAYKIALDKDKRAGVQFNYTKTGAVFVFETTFCGSVSALEKFLAFVNNHSTNGIKSLQVRLRDEQTKETSEFKKFTYNNLTLSIVGYLRDTLDIKGYNKIKVNQLEVIPSDNIYGLIVTFKK
ncbi:MAG: hypothetical protein UHD07_05490 [Ruminobacter sp.]|nr:hypothetical protein [Ruminobacter sp.]